MKKLIWRSFYFLIFTSVGYVILLCLWGLFLPNMFKQNLNYKIGSYGHMNSRIKDLKNVTDIDILFLGSSHVYRGIDPRIFEAHGYKVFNLGSSAQTPIQTRLLLNRYLDSLKPKLILYDLFPESLINDGVESSLDIIANSENDMESLKMVIVINHIKTYNTFIYGVFRDIMNYSSKYREDRVKDKDTYIKGGFVEKELSFNKNTRSFPRTISEYKSKQIKAFQNVLEIIQAHNIPYTLIQIPVTQHRFKKHNNVLFDNYLKAHGDYYNFNHLIKLNDTLHFYDTQHLNSEGVQVFNEFLINTILEK